MFRQRMVSVRNEPELMSYLKSLQIVPGTARQSVMARNQFDMLYRKTREWVADVLTGIEEHEARIRRERMEEKMNRSDRYYDYEKRDILKRNEEQVRRYHETEIGAAQIEQVAFASIPRDRNGNMRPMKESTLNTQFAGTRLNRQHLGDILSGKAQITRYDLIMLCFYVDAHQKAGDRSRLQIYRSFLERTNRILQSCGMGPLYTANPFECFLLMCQLSDDPMGTYADVVEKSYQEAVQ